MMLDMADRKSTRSTPKRSQKKPARKAAPKSSPKGGQKRIPLSALFFIFLLVALVTTFFILLPKTSDKASVHDGQIAATPSTPQESPAQEALPAPEPPKAQEPKPQKEEEKPVAEVPETPQETALATKPPPEPAPETRRTRGIYFMQSSAGGEELHLAKISRSLRASDTPLFDSISALLDGPTDAEQDADFLSLIPPGTRIIEAVIRGNTAYLNFSEEFQYNSFGREGFASQIRQIVWTATEFPSVHDVQFLIEGKRIDYISEGIMIGSPIGR
jgi:hypothetical protein